MSDEPHKKASNTGRSTAGDAESTQMIPRIDRAEPTQADADRGAEAKSPAEKRAAPADQPQASAGQKPTSPQSSGEKSAKHSGVQVHDAGQTAPKRLTAADYAKSSSQVKPTDSAPRSNRPDETSEIPRVPASTAPAASTSAGAASSTRRQAHLRIVSVDPWSVTKISFALSVALAVVTVVAVSILWVVLGVFGVWDAINSSVSVVLSNEAEAFDVTDYVGYGRVIGLTLVVSAINVVLITAIATIATYLYNLATQLLGGVDLTLSDEG